MYQYKVAFPASDVPLDQTPFLSFLIFPMCKPNHFPHVKLCPASCFLRDKTKTSVWYGGFAYIRVPAYFSNQSSSYAHIFDITFRHIQLLRVPEAQHERKFSPKSQHLLSMSAPKKWSLDLFHSPSFLGASVFFP